MKKLRKKRQKKQKKEYNPICGYCVTYAAANDEQRSAGGIRECTQIDSPVEFNTKACDNFKFIKIFYCDRDGQRLYVDVCISRQDKRVCKNCSQGKLISGIKEKYNEQIGTEETDN